MRALVSTKYANCSSSIQDLDHFVIGFAAAGNNQFSLSQYDW